VIGKATQAGLRVCFSYRNTFFHTEPLIDIIDPPTELLGTLDSVISTDVFEHVVPPVERAFEGAFRLLKPGSALVLTVPFTKLKVQRRRGTLPNAQ
jgi:hypothetical protein